MKLASTFLIAGGLGAVALLMVVPRASSQPAPAQTGAPTPAPTGGVPAVPGPGRGGGGGRGAQPFDYSDNEGWVSLFDGQTLNGWDGDPRFWSVKDGAIYVQATCEKPTGTIYLVWQGGEPSDFELKWEFKATGNDNGGMQYRSYITADNNVTFKYPGRGGGGTLGRGATAAAPAGAVDVTVIAWGPARSARTPARLRPPPSGRSGIWPARSSISMQATSIRGSITSSWAGASWLVRVR